MNGRFRAKYISDVPDDYLKKGEIYEVFKPKGAIKADLTGYVDKNGEKYAVPSDRFEIVEDKLLCKVSAFRTKGGFEVMR